MITHLKTISIAFVCVILMGCELYPQDEFEEDYVVESYLVANRTLPQVRISKTVPVDQEYNYRDAAVNDANVEVRLMDQSGEEVEQQFQYGRQSDGVYVTNSPHKVLPQREYQLHVTFSNSDKEVLGSTLVPGEFTSENMSGDTVRYQDPEQVTINTTRSFYPGRQSFFIFTVEALEPEEEDLTPFYADQVDNDAEVNDFYSNSSGIINEENYEENEDGTLTLRLPWLAVAFYEENYIIASAIDDNMYDFYRTQDVQGGGSTLPPGELQNVIYNLEGGIGVFGSMASDTVRVFFSRNQ